MDVATLVFADCLEEIILSKKILKPRRKYWEKLADEFLENRGVKNWEKHHKVLGWIK
ncbi:MAG: hypothetical protein H0X15_00910 [Acidobacteria bacterium]|jgi:hypothetical protein|nr:hypothetical protein [Acidobacteriota bacterium]MBA4123324.1 hypothetical protein [Acidobacteriota bacterium]MBA4186273.1 hypothetical protein [Acidobacteriota bacterium]